MCSIYQPAHYNIKFDICLFKDLYLFMFFVWNKFTSVYSIWCSEFISLFNSLCL